MSVHFPRCSLPLFAFAATAFGHDSVTGEAHPHYDESARPPAFFLAQATMPIREKPPAARPEAAAVFAAFSPRVSVHWDEHFLMVESNGLPTHPMMIGITAWQQQVPVPQNYRGTNAWQIPLSPLEAKLPRSIKGHFLRGAIALAANGIPIFNPQNNRGEISAEIGELDRWGGHCGRADDYHYHAAPLHLQSVVGAGRPIAYALDGYPLHGLTEPDGSEPTGLDEFNGHTTAALGYHYHASKTYPYVNGGFHGEVVERDGQVDPQPRAHPVRPDLPPLRGAKITAFTASPDDQNFTLQYEVSGNKAAVNYQAESGGRWKFQFAAADGSQREETYREGRPEAATSSPEKAAVFQLQSPVVANGGTLPVEFTGDGPGSTLPLEWSGAPAGTKSYALIMHHLDKEGVTKYYWTLYNIPAEVTHLDKNTLGIGKLGASFKGQVGYEPPHSQGPGAKTYVLTLYALSSELKINVAARQITGAFLSAAIKDKVLASTDLSVVYSR
jgi:phosphatidylethanolamine-binding protein (PEBP) family uncharacterized protein